MILFGILVGVWFTTNFRVPSWLGGHPTTVILGRKLDHPVQPVDMNNSNQTFRQVAESVKPSVVYIEVVARRKRNDKMPNDKTHNFDEKSNSLWNELYEETAGSGVITSKEGYIVTNYHVIEGAQRISVLLDDKREFQADLIGSDPSTDLAVIKIPPNADLPVVPLGDDRQLAVGDWVIAIGSPFRLTSTVTAGIVSALGRQINIIDKKNLPIEDFIQTDAAINPGNSGGALVNTKGELVGINSAIATDSGSYEGYGFAVPVGLMARITRDLIQYGSVKRGYLGVYMDAVDANYAQQLGLSRIQGVVIIDLVPNGAAHRAGLYPGDVILKVNGLAVNQENELQRAIAMNKPGDTITLDVWRLGQEQEVKVRLDLLQQPKLSENLAQIPAPTLLPPSNEEGNAASSKKFSPVDASRWGLKVRALNKEEVSRFQTSLGVMLQSAEQGKAIQKAQLPVGSVITMVEKIPIRSESQLMVALSQVSEKQESVLLQVKKADGSTAFYDVEVPR